MAKSVLSAPHFQDESAAFEYVESKLWPTGPVCPHCGNADAAKIGRLQGKTTRPGLRKCYECMKPFTVRMGTIFESSHLKLHLWLQVIHLICAGKKGIATREIQRMLQCSMKTAWFLSHRIREAMAPRDGSVDPMGGRGKRVEMDETYVGGKERNKHASKRSKNPKGKGDKEIVFSLVERGGKVRSHHVPEVTARNLRPIVLAQVKAGTHVMTDDGGAVLSAGRMYPNHQSITPLASTFAGTPTRTRLRVIFPSSSAALLACITTSVSST